MSLDFDDGVMTDNAYWQDQLTSALKENSYTTWIERGKDVVSRYRDQRPLSDKGRSKYNILWSNIQVLKPALYGTKPAAQVSRRFQDKNPVARTASLILQRCLQYEIDQYSHFDSALSNAVDDRLLPGRGVAWVRFEMEDRDVTPEQDDAYSDIAEDEMSLMATMQDGAFGDNSDMQESNFGDFSYQISEDTQTKNTNYECAPTDYVYWKDFLHSPSRTWEEVWWVARRVYMTKSEIDERFGPNSSNNLPFSTITDDEEDGYEKKSVEDKKCEVWEVWCANNKMVYWMVRGYPMFLDKKEDPLELDGFFPCPKPLFATTATDSLVRS